MAILVETILLTTLLIENDLVHLVNLIIKIFNETIHFTYFVFILLILNFELF